MNDYIYVPILKWKQGECLAIKELNNQIKSLILPLIEIVPNSMNPYTKEMNKTLQKQIDDSVQNIIKTWSNRRKILIDPYFINKSKEEIEGMSPGQYLFKKCRENNIDFVPVVSDLTKKTYSNSCLRINFEDADFTKIELNLNNITEFTEMFVVLDFKRIDFKKIDKDEYIKLINKTVNILNKFSLKIIAISGTGFPVNLIGLQPDDIHQIIRTEKSLWDSIEDSLKKKLVFSDYGISGYELPISDKPVSMSANIRYTQSNCWLVYKARSVKVHSYNQFHDLASSIVDSEEYSGPNFSWGDAYINECAKGIVGPGNASTWRKVGTSHHITFVIHELGYNFLL